MANIVITTSGSNSIVVAFNDYSSVVEATKRSYDNRDIVEVEYYTDYVEVMMRDAHGLNIWMLTYDSSYSGDQRFIVDSVAGVAPTSESDLFDKITALRG